MASDKEFAATQVEISKLRRKAEMQEREIESLRERLRNVLKHNIEEARRQTNSLHYPLTEDGKLSFDTAVRMINDILARCEHHIEIHIPFNSCR